MKTSFGAIMEDIQQLSSYASTGSYEMCGSTDDGYELGEMVHREVTELYQEVVRRDLLMVLHGRIASHPGRTWMQVDDNTMKLLLLILEDIQDDIQGYEVAEVIIGSDLKLAINLLRSEVYRKGP